MAIPVILGTIGGLLHHAPSKSQQQYLDLAMAGSVHDATAVAEFASQTSLPDWAGWEAAWEELIQRNPALAAQGYALARAKPQLNPSSGDFTSSRTTVTQTTGGPPAGGGTASGGGIADSIAKFLSSVTQPSSQAAGAAAGQAAAKQAQSTLITIGLVVAGAIVVGALILRRR